MEEGQLAGINAATALRYYDSDQKEKLSQEVWDKLDSLGVEPGKRRLAKEK